MTLFPKYLDHIMVTMQGFKKFEMAIVFHKAFRSWDVIDVEDGVLDSIIWDALNGAKLFHYFYNTLVLEQFDEWKENN